MQRDQFHVTSEYAGRKTQSRKLQCDATIKFALQLAVDPQKRERRGNQLCPYCFYGEAGIAGAAMTNQPCGICGEMQMYTSTATDLLCSSCATKHRLCKECGADVDLRITRKIAF